jgi:hypothetical protein
LGEHGECCKRFEGLLPAFLSIVFITDGAEWIKQWMDRSDPKALQILDFYHPFQHLAQSVSGLIRPCDWLLTQKQLLSERKSDTVKALK